MKKLILAFAAFALISASAHSETILCTGGEDGPAVQASLDAGGVTTLQGVCVTSSVVTIHQAAGLGNQNGETVLQEGTLRSAGVVLDGNRRVAIRGTEIYSSGTGITIKNTIQVELNGIYVSSQGDCIDMQNIAAVWINGKSQCSAGINAGSSVGLRIGSTSTGFESVDVSGLLVEGYYACVRIGGTGNNVNMWFRGLKCDRPAMYGVLISPLTTASARNIMITDFWINGSQYPFALNRAETSGELVRVEIINGHVLGATYPQVTVWGSGVDYRATGIVYGPLEPG